MIKRTTSLNPSRERSSRLQGGKRHTYSLPQTPPWPCHVSSSAWPTWQIRPGSSLRSSPASAGRPRASGDLALGRSAKWRLGVSGTAAIATRWIESILVSHSVQVPILSPGYCSSREVRVTEGGKRNRNHHTRLSIVVAPIVLIKYMARWTRNTVRTRDSMLGGSRVCYRRDDRNCRRN